MWIFLMLTVGLVVIGYLVFLYRDELHLNQQDEHREEINRDRAENREWYEEEKKRMRRERESASGSENDEDDD